MPRFSLVPLVALVIAGSACTTTGPVNSGDTTDLGVPSSCTRDEDCPGKLLCRESRCVSPTAPADLASSSDDRTDPSPQPDLAPAGCVRTTATDMCNYVDGTDPNASFRDKQSYRTVTGYYCFDASTMKSGWTTTRVCDLTEQCMADAMAVNATCVSCGRLGRKSAKRTVDGVLKEDCAGCQCSGGWSVYGCYTDTQTYGEPWMDVVWQQGFEVLRFAVTSSGKVFPNTLPGDNLATGVTLQSADIEPGGDVEFDISVDGTRPDSYQLMHTWHLAAHVVSSCK